MFRAVKAVNGGDLIPKSPGQPGNIGSCGFDVIDFISQVLHLLFGNAVFEHTVETVSYTHLDVYKRQPHNGIKEAVGEVGFLKALCGDRGLLI